MKRTVLVLPALLSGFLLSGCAIPSAVTSIGYALDGISYVASGKGVADHALSASQDRDCAIFRAVTGGGICRDVDAPASHAGPALSMIDTAAGEAAAAPGWLISGGADVQGQIAQGRFAAGLQDGLIATDPSSAMTGDIAEADTAPVPAGKPASHL